MMALLGPLWEWRLAARYGTSPDAGLADVAWDALVVLALYDTWFYWAHRAVHECGSRRPVDIHAEHHRVPHTDVAALYAHPLEHVFVNAGPLVGSIVVTGAAPGAACFVVAVWTYNTVCVHSGVEGPWGRAGFHKRHHDRWTCNYGFGVWDYVIGTQMLG